jgi:hypothetical protein
MTQNAEQSGQMSDPDGSIFLPKTEREYGDILFALLQDRGIGAGKTLEQKQALLQQIQEERDRQLGAEAVKAV